MIKILSKFIERIFSRLRQCRWNSSSKKFQKIPKKFKTKSLGRRVEFPIHWDAVEGFFPFAFRMVSPANDQNDQNDENGSLSPFKGKSIPPQSNNKDVEIQMPPSFNIKERKKPQESIKNPLGIPFHPKESHFIPFHPISSHFISQNLIEYRQKSF